MNAVQQNWIVRFNLAQRVEHALLILSFTTLALTGLPQKYAMAPISIWFIQVLGGIETVRIIHRIAATMFLLESIYHLIVMGYKLYVRRRAASMMPGIKDAQDAVQAFLYNIGIAKTSPKMGRYNFAEKMEYWAMAWGLIVMALTGFMLWNPLATTRLLPGEFIPAAKIAHGGEAVLAVLAIILWHFYSVHLKHWNSSLWTGKLSRKMMQEEHGAELEAIEKGSGYVPPAPVVARQRMAIFTPVAAVVTLALVAGLYYFVTFEQTAVSAVPPVERAQILVTQTPTATFTPAPTSTPVPATPTPEGGAKPTATAASGGAAASGATWNSEIGALFKDKCGTCHSGSGSGGFSIDDYASVSKFLTPGDADGSKIVEVQKAGHMGKFSDDQLNKVIDWIKAGAPEK